MAKAEPYAWLTPMYASETDRAAREHAIRAQLTEVQQALRVFDDQRDVSVGLIHAYEGWLRLHAERKVRCDCHPAAPPASEAE